MQCGRERESMAAPGIVREGGTTGQSKSDATSSFRRNYISASHTVMGKGITVTLVIWSQGKKKCCICILSAF